MNKIWPIYRTKVFAEVWESDDDFITDYNTHPLGHVFDDDVGASATHTTAKIIYYLLVAKYKNSSISNYDEEQFKYKVFSIIWQYGKTWQARTTLQDKVRDLLKDDNIEELFQGSKAIYNHAMNPNTEPGTAELEELEYISDQNTTNWKKPKMEAYANLWEVLKNDWTEQFIKKFEPLFSKFCGFRER